MLVSIEQVKFTFNGICGTCQQEQYDEDSEEVFQDQVLTIADLLEAGTPLCPLCDNELPPDTNCTLEEAI